MIYPNTVTPQLLEIAQKLSASPKLESFRLVGGTAIALQIGHRLSVDIDFFTNEIVGTVDTDGKYLFNQKTIQLLPLARIPTMKMSCIDVWNIWRERDAS